MALRMDRTEMIKMLHELDAELKAVLEIEICGSSCAILSHGLGRASTDIDVMRSSIPFEEENLHQAIYSVAIHNGSDAQWINDHAKEVFKHIPDDFKPDTSPITGENFKLLRPKVISKADFIITKLAYYDRIRQWDISDIKSLRLSPEDVDSIFRKLDRISEKRHCDALMIEGNFKAIRSDLVKDIHGHSYVTGRNIAEYAFERFGIRITSHEEAVWQESIDNLTAKPGALTAKIDLQAAKFIGKNSANILEFDRKYRAIREKSMDHDFDQ
jgi:hypothetical protein